MNSFPPPKIFTNAMLNMTDITALIRDTAVHERPLFSVPPPPPPPKAQDPSSTAKRRTAYNPQGSSTDYGGGDSTSAVRAPKRNAAVAAVLGGDLFKQIRRADAGTAGNGSEFAEARKGELDVEILLKGAEKLCSV